MTNITEKSFRPVLALLRFANLYPNQDKSRLQKMWSYVIYIQLVYMAASSTLELIYGEDLDDIQTNLTVLVVISNGFGSFKILSLLTNGTRIKKCFDYFQDERFRPKSDAEKKILDNCVQVCKRNVVIYWTVVLWDSLLWCIYRFFGKKSLPASFWLPYDYRSGPLVFYFTYFVASIGFFYACFVSQGIEPLVGGLVYQGMCQIRILRHNLENLQEKENVLEMLKRCIMLHNDILHFFEEYEKSFSFLIFCQLGGTTLGLCYSCIGLYTNPKGNTMYSFICIGIYLALSFQIFFYCCFGSLLFEENERLTVAIYMSNWYEYDVGSRRLLITIMECSKKPLILTAGKIVNLTYATFTSVLKTGYSLVAVLNSSL